MTLTFAQGHNCVSKLDKCLTCSLIVISRIFSCDIQTWHDCRLVHGILMLILMTLTLIQGHSGPTKENKSTFSYLANKASNKLKLAADYCIII